MLNKQKGNMYPFVSHTWNPIKGKCSHDCKYCYMKRFKQKPIRLVEKELNDNLGEKNFIFVGSSVDMFADDVPREWIIDVLFQCTEYPKNTYLFQSKNPKRFKEFNKYFPDNIILGTTIETNREGFNYKAPPVTERQYHIQEFDFKIMITIEPIIDFDFDIMVNWLKDINPDFVSIGADSKGHNLPEPSPQKIQNLIHELEKFTKVIKKDNLKRLIT